MFLTKKNIANRVSAYYLFYWDQPYFLPIQYEAYIKSIYHWNVSFMRVKKDFKNH